jgi:plasmid stabilization system protein ParE
MEKYRLTPEAVSDLFEIWNFISQGNTEAANGLKNQFCGPATFWPTLHSPVV